MSKENTAAALTSIGIEKAISRIDAVAAQELDAKTEEDSPDEESDDGPSNQDLEEDEKVSLLFDEEDEKPQVVKLLLTKPWMMKRCKPLSQIKAQKTTLMKLLMMKTSSLVMITRRRRARNMTID